MHSHPNREALLKSFEALQAQFESSLADALSHEKKFETIRQNFMRQLSAHLSEARKGLPDRNPLKQHLNP